MRFIPVYIAILASTLFSGCLNDTLDSIDEQSFQWRNHFRAMSAWSEVKHGYSDVDHPSHFKSGFMAGFEAAAMGGAPCPPALPPRKYWSAGYANFEGQQKQVSWFNGFEHGVFAAQSSGAGEGTKIITPVKAAPLCPVKAEHQVFGKEGESLDHEKGIHHNGNHGNADDNPPAVPPVPNTPDYDTSAEFVSPNQNAIEVKQTEADPFSQKEQVPEQSFQTPIIIEEDGDGVSLNQSETEHFSLVKNERTEQGDLSPNSDLNVFFED